MIRVTVEDASLALAVTVEASGGYSPDVVHDLQARALESYRLALVDKLAVMKANGIPLPAA